MCPPTEQDRWSWGVFMDAVEQVDELTRGGDD